MLSNDKVAKGVGADVVGEGEVEAKEETVAVRELVEDSNSVVVLSVVQSKLEKSCFIHLLLRQSDNNSCILLSTGAMLCIKQGVSLNAN